MKFCEKCKSLMVPKKKGTKTVMVCTSCNATDEKVEHATIRETVADKKKMDIIDEDAEQHLPLTDEKCPKCGHGKAYYWMTQTRAADESPTKFLRCQECRHTWRDYS